MGSKYRPTIRDQQAQRRYHEQVRRTKADGPVKNLLHLPVPKAPAAKDAPAKG